MKYILSLLFVLCLPVLAQEGPEDPSLDSAYLLSRMVEMWDEEIIPAMGDVQALNGKVEIFTRAYTQAQTAMVEEYGQGMLSLYEYAKRTREALDWFARINELGGNHEAAKGLVEKGTKPLHNTDLELRSLAVIRMIVEDQPVDQDFTQAQKNSEIVQVLHRMVDHPEFLVHPDPMVRNSQADALLYLADFEFDRKNYQQSADALEWYIAASVSEDFALSTDIEDVIDNYQTVLLYLPYRPDLSVDFEADALAIAEEIRSGNTERGRLTSSLVDQVYLYEQQMEAKMRANLDLLRNLPNK